MYSLILLVILAGLTIASAILWAVCLKLGLQWVRVPGVTTGGIAAATAIVLGLQLVGYLALSFVPARQASHDKLLLILQIVANVALPVAVTMILFRTSISQALLAYLWTLAATLSGLLFVLILLRPFVMEAFSVPTHAMAPTILGRHVTAICTECGLPCYRSPPDHYQQDEPQEMICPKFHVTDHTDYPARVDDGDKVLVAKFLQARRWDLVVFRFPEDPRVVYLSRLVGLPGEKIFVNDGAVWINDERMEPPKELTGLNYLSEIPEYSEPLNGTPNRPAVLSEDEYFVLGDFSLNAYDSRLWQDNSSGRSPFAVPATNLIGVVTTIYWPPSRWRNLR